MPKVSVSIRNGNLVFESHCEKRSPKCSLIGLERIGEVKTQGVKRNGKRKDRTQDP